MSVLRVKWEKQCEPDFRVLHCDQEVPTTFVPGFLGMMGVDIIEEGSAGKEFLDELMSIHGVEKVAADKYQICIKKGHVFDWSEVTPRVEQVVRDYLGAGKVSVKQ